MDRRGAGIGLLFIGSLLMISRYIAAAILGSNGTGVNEAIYNMLFDAVGPSLTKSSTLFFILGILYLVISELSEIFKLLGKDMKTGNAVNSKDKQKDINISEEI